MSSLSHPPFLFADHWPSDVATRVRLRAGLNTKTSLLRALAHQFHFPDYFGENWDALEECIRDLSWLPDGDVALEHSDVPLASSRGDLNIYLAILRDLVNETQSSGTGRFYVTFPEHTRRDVEAVLRDA